MWEVRNRGCFQTQFGALVSDQRKKYTLKYLFFVIVGVHVKKLIVGLRYIKLTKKLLGYWLTDANSIHQTYHIDDRST